MDQGAEASRKAREPHRKRHPSTSRRLASHTLPWMRNTPFKQGPAPKDPDSAASDPSGPRCVTAHTPSSSGSISAADDVRRRCSLPGWNGRCDRYRPTVHPAASFSVHRPTLAASETDSSDRTCGGAARAHGGRSHASVEATSVCRVPPTFASSRRVEGSASPAPTKATTHPERPMAPRREASTSRE